MKSVRLGCRLSLHPLVAALHSPSLSTLLPPPPPSIAFPSLSSSPFSCLSDSLPLPTRSVSFARPRSDRAPLLSLSLSLPPLLLFPQRSLSAPVRRGAGAKRTKPKLKLGCRLLRRLFLRRCWLLAADAGTAAGAAASAASTLPLSISIHPRLLLFHAFLLTFLLLLPIPSLSLSVVPRPTTTPRPKEPGGVSPREEGKGREREREREGFSLHRPRSSRRHCPKLVGEMARHSFRHRNQLARLLFHTATHPLRDHRSHPTYPPLFFCVPDESRTRE